MASSQRGSGRPKVTAIPAPAPADTQQTFSSSHKIDLSPHLVYADYRIVTHILAEHLVSIPLCCSFGSPFDRIATMQQLAPFMNIEMASETYALRPLGEIYSTEGISGFFVGNLTGILQDSVFKSSDAIIEELFHHYSFGNIYSFVAANVLARLISYPLVTIRRRIQIIRDPEQDRSILGVLRATVQHKGYLGLWDGVFWKIVADLLQLLLQFGVMRLILGYNPDISHPRPHELFSLAMGTCIAACAVVPLRTLTKCKQVSNEWPSIQDITEQYGKKLFVNGLLATALSSCLNVFGLVTSSFITHHFLE